MKKDNFIVYHRVDFDGLMSGSIVRLFSINNKQSYDTLGWNYNDTLPDFEKIVNEYSNIILVDISFPAEIMKKLSNSNINMIWIDHHITAINDSTEFGYDNVDGIRKIGIAACELTWEYFYKAVETPRIIEYCSAYDVWNKNRFDWDSKTLAVHKAMEDRYGINFENFFSEINDMLFDSNCLDYFEKTGQALVIHDKKLGEREISSYGFPVTVAGKYKGICLMDAQFGSSMFESVIDKYDIYIVVNRKDSKNFKLSMYKEVGRIPEFNCGEYLKNNFGGGGHEGAAGTLIKWDTFIELSMNQTI